MRLGELCLVAAVLAAVSPGVDATIMAQLGSRGFDSVGYFEDFDGAAFGNISETYFPPTSYTLTSGGFSFGFSSAPTTAGIHFVIWSGKDSVVGFDTHSLYQNGVADAMMTISLANGANIGQIEFDIANGGQTNPHNVWIRTYRDGAPTGFDFEFSAAPRATIAVWTDGDTAFDELRLASYGKNGITREETQASATSIDNVRAVIFGAGASHDIPEPASLGSMLLGLACMRLVRNRRRATGRRAGACPQ